MFQFPGFASLRREMTVLTDRRVAPFGHLGITACVPLPRASRSLPRPSSPPCAQASPTCLPSLDHIWRKQSTRFISQSTYTNPTPIPRLTPRHAHRLGKDSISHESVIGQKTKADDPSSVLHFSNSDRDSPALAVSLALSV